MKVAADSVVVVPVENTAAKIVENTASIIPDSVDTAAGIVVVAVFAVLLVAENTANMIAGFAADSIVEVAPLVRGIERMIAQKTIADIAEVADFLVVVVVAEIALAVGIAADVALKDSIEL